MSKVSIYARLIKKAILTVQTLFTDVNINVFIEHEEKLGVIALLLHDAFISDSDLDTYVTNGWITTGEKVAVINEANLL